MKVFVVFALFAVALSDLCQNKNANLADAEDIRVIIRAGSLTVFGHCASFNIDQILFSGSCKKLFDQAFCYGQIAEYRYRDVETVSYKLLKGDVNRIQELGELSCDHARNCINSFASAFQDCAELDDNFVGKTIDAVEGLYMKQIQAQLKEYADSNADTIVGELINLVFSRFRSVSDIEDAINEYVTADIIADAKVAASAIEQAAMDWCNSNCGTETGKFMKMLFTKMHGGACQDASVFCGACAQRANNFFVRGGAIPCCLNDVVEQALAGVSYIEETYDGLISDFREYLSGELSDESVAYATEIKNRIVAEITCLSEVYTTHKPKDGVCPGPSA